MNKTELAASVAEQLKMTKNDAENVVEAVFNTITAELAKGGKVQIVGFGAFETKVRAAYTGHDPRTMEPMQIAESRVPGFKPGKNLKEAVQK